MLNPEVLADAIVAAWQSIPGLVAAMGGDRNNILAHKFYYGIENNLGKAVSELNPPAILVAWRGTMGGNFDGQTIWKHPFEVYIRTKNAASDQIPSGPGHVWWLMMNGAVNGTTLNIRQIQLLPNVDPMDTPTITARQDEDLMDFFCASLVIPEIGDDA